MTSRVIGPDAVVDDPADDVRADRAGQPLEHADEAGDGDDPPLLAQQPEEEALGAAQVGVGEQLARAPAPRPVPCFVGVHQRGEVVHDRSRLVSRPPGHEPFSRDGARTPCWCGDGARRRSQRAGRGRAGRRKAERLGLRRRGRPGGDGPGPAARPGGRRGHGAGEARRLPARLPRRHHPPDDARPAARPRAGRAPRRRPAHPVLDPRRGGERRPPAGGGHAVGRPVPRGLADAAVGPARPARGRRPRAPDLHPAHGHERDRARPRGRPRRRRAGGRARRTGAGSRRPGGRRRRPGLDRARGGRAPAAPRPAYRSTCCGSGSTATTSRRPTPSATSAATWSSRSRGSATTRPPC